MSKAPESKPEQHTQPETRTDSGATLSSHPEMQYGKEMLTAMREQKKQKGAVPESEALLPNTLIASAETPEQSTFAGPIPATDTWPLGGADATESQWHAKLRLMLLRDDGAITDSEQQTFKNLHDTDPKKFDQVMLDLSKEEPRLIDIEPADGKPPVTKVKRHIPGHSAGQQLYP